MIAMFLFLMFMAGLAIYWCGVARKIKAQNAICDTSRVIHYKAEQGDFSVVSRDTPTRENVPKASTGTVCFRKHTDN
jgi:hypothetical protein